MPDYIEREAGLIELCRGCSLRGIDPNFFCGDACPKYKRIAAIPAADVRPVVHATWETDTCHFYCSECEHYVDYKTNFCPNCGADMREES